MLDLHTHTVNSDGEFTTIELLEKAEKLGLEYLAITDHDTVLAYDDLNKISISDYYSGKIIRGTELEFAYDGRIMEILGYNIDIEKIKQTKPIIKEANKDVIVESKECLKYLKNISDKLNLKYSDNLDIRAKNDMPNDMMIDDLRRYAENKEILENLGIPENDPFYRTTFYRKHVCNSKSPFYIDRTIGAMTINEVVDAIHYAGGKAVLAHAFVYGYDDIKEIIEKITQLGIIDGIECGHRKHTEEQRIYLSDYADKQGLLKTAGSDFHKDSDCLGHISYKEREITEEIISKAILGI